MAELSQKFETHQQGPLARGELTQFDAVDATNERCLRSNAILNWLRRRTYAPSYQSSSRLICCSTYEPKHALILSYAEMGVLVPRSANGFLAQGSVAPFSKSKVIGGQVRCLDRNLDDTPPHAPGEALLSVSNDNSAKEHSTAQSSRVSHRIVGWK